VNGAGRAKLCEQYRLHLSDGVVHFHDGELKAGLPVEVWWRAWDALTTGQRSEFTYLDASNKTQLTVTMTGLAQGMPEVIVYLASAKIAKATDLKSRTLSLECGRIDRV
jgi:hypothetical protein